MFNSLILRQLKGGKGGTALRARPSRTETVAMSAKWVRNFLILLYFIVGGFVAWEHGYLGVGWLRTVGSGLLAILLWFLVPLGVNLHIHG
jgi:hypothetical protein